MPTLSNKKKKTSIKDEICGTLKKINDEDVNKLLEKLLEFKIKDKFAFQSPETVNSKDFHNYVQSEIKNLYKGNLCI